MMATLVRRLAVAFVALTSLAKAAAIENEKPGEDALKNELRPLGWIAYTAKTEDGDWDLFLMRPDGSDRRKLTDSRDFNEAGARFSSDGQRLLYYRMAKSVPVDNNTYGTFDLVIADAANRSPVVWGNRFAWASWSPDGTRLACLSPQGIQIFDLSTQKIVRQFARKGIVSQLIWSPDGRHFVGTANGLGPYWNIGRLDAESGELVAVSETDRYNCTPDWLPDSRHVVYARGIVPNIAGRAELWTAASDGQERRPLYVEASRHIYGACASPDGKYVLFTRSVADLGKVDHSETTMAIIRWSDTPILGDGDQGLRQRLPKAGIGPRLDLGPGWEPCWTATAVVRNAD